MSIFVTILGACCLVIIFGTFLATGAVLVAGIAEEIARVIYQHRKKPLEQRKLRDANIENIEQELGLGDYG